MELPFDISARKPNLRQGTKLLLPLLLMLWCGVPKTKHYARIIPPYGISILLHQPCAQTAAGHAENNHGAPPQVALAKAWACR
jgi:hypothetical protein